MKKLGVRNAKKSKVQCVRYADDFVVTAASKELLEDVVKPWVEQFLSARGVALSREKTQITHIHQGFDFLGWNFRKYVPKSPYRNAKLLIKPSKKNVSAFYRKVREIIKGSGALTQDALIGQLNPVLKGWAQYHSPVVAKRPSASWIILFSGESGGGRSGGIRGSRLIGSGINTSDP